MRISGGTAKGRKIGVRKAFSQEREEDELRPTPAKVREALFNIIRGELPGSSFLDLYAGTGAVGIEALSRGASKVVFVETNALRVKIIKYLLSEFSFGDRAEVFRMKAYEFVKRIGSRGVSFDIVFLDPPYYSEELTEILPLIGEGALLKDKGLVVIEHFHKVPLPAVREGLGFMKSYRYGDTVLSLYRREAA